MEASHPYVYDNFFPIIFYLSVEAWLRSVCCCGCWTCWYNRGCWRRDGWVDAFRMGGWGDAKGWQDGWIILELVEHTFCVSRTSPTILEMLNLWQIKGGWKLSCAATTRCNLQWMVVYWHNARGEIYSKRITREEIHSRLTGEQSMHLLKLLQTVCFPELDWSSIQIDCRKLCYFHDEICSENQWLMFC